MFLEGHTPNGIARHLTKEGIPTPAGKTEWEASTVRNILKNEKYCGSATLQKTYCSDFLTKKIKINKGEITSYFVENSHQGIVSVEVFDLVQYELRKRKNQGYTTKDSCLSSKIICADCGGFYGSKVWHSKDKYRRVIWQCNRKFKKTEKCTTPHLDEHIIKDAFVSAFNSMMANKTEILDGYDLVISRLTDSSELERSRDQISSQMKKVETLVEGLVAKNANTLLDQEEYKERYDEYSKQYHDLKDHRSQVNADIGQLKIKRSRMQAYISVLKGRKTLLKSFDEGLIAATLESVTVHADRHAVFKFRDDSELVWPLPDKGAQRSFAAISDKGTRQID